MNLKKMSNAKKGFTLIEILVSMVILSLMASGFFSVMISGRQMVARSKRRLVAAEIARREIENKRHLIRADQWDNVSSPIYPMAAGGWADWNMSSPPYEYRYRMENATGGAQFRRITVEVRWNVSNI